MKSLFKLVAAMAVIVAIAWPAANATPVTFQVDMAIQVIMGNFVPGTDTVVVRGDFNGWAGDSLLLTDADADTIYTSTFEIASNPTAYGYKFVISPNTWENSIANREVTVGSDPLVLPVVFFDDVDTMPSGFADVEVNFRVNMTVQDLSGNFDPTTDWVVVRGDHPNIGSWGGATRLIEETGNPGIYSLWVQFDSLEQDAGLEYKFVILDNGDPNAASWESSNNRSFIPTGEEPDNLPPPSGNGYGEIMPELVYFSDIGPEDILTQDLNVIFSVDARPLFYRLRDVGYVYDVQTGDTIYAVESLQIAGFFNNWPWGNFAQEYYMNDAGTNGDLTAGDTVWSATRVFAAGSPRSLIYKYGCNQLDAEAGFARNHDRDLADTGGNFRMDTDCWGSPDTLFAPYECLYSGIGDENPGQVNAYSLNQNYPNPFNPSTTISFALPRADEMTLRVFDLLGRQVSDMKLGKLEAGAHNVHFDGSNVASGLYFYTLSSSSFTATRKMLLMK